MDTTNEQALIRYETAFRESDAGILEWIADSATAVFDRTPAELVGTDLAALVRVEDATALHSARDRARAGASARYDAVVETSTGPRTITVLMEPVFSIDGAPAGRVGVCRTARPVAGDVAGWAGRYRARIESTGDVVCLYSPDGVLEWVSPAVSTILGFDPAAVIGTKPAWVHADDRVGLVADIIDAQATGRDRVTRRCRLLGADRRVVWVDAEVQLLRDVDGSVAFLSSVLHDVTDLVQREALGQIKAAETKRLLQRRESVLAALIDPMMVLEAVRDDRARITDFSVAVASKSAIEFFGIPLDELVVSTMLVSFRDQQSTRLFEACVKVIERQQPRRWSAQPLPHSVSGRVRLYDISMVPSGDDLAVTWRDVTDEWEQRRILGDSIAFNRAILDASPVGLVAYRADGSVAECNPAAQRILGLTREQLLGTVPSDPGWSAVREDGTHLPDTEYPARTVRATGLPVRDFVMGIRHPDGDTTWLSANAEPFGERTAEGTCGAVVAFADITRVHRTLDDAATSAADAQALADSTPDLLLKVAYDGTIRWASHASRSLLGIEPVDLVGVRNVDLVHPDDRAALAAVVAAARERHEPTFATLRVRRADGSWLWVNSAGADADVPGGVEPYRVVRLRSVDAEIREAEELARRAEHDDLTGALNRAAGLQRLAGMTQTMPGSATSIAVLFIDLDEFKAINDFHGHAVGDAVLREVTRRIRSRVRRADLVIRFGGDEILVALTGVRTLHQALRTATDIHETATDPFELGDLVIIPRMSCGMTLVEPLDTLTTIIERADAAMYRAKHDGGNRIAIDPRA